MTARQEHECVRCGLEQGYHRAVVETTLDEEIGSLCSRCEDAAFEGLIRIHDRSATCAFCTRDGLYALPMWESHSTVRGDVVFYSTEYDVTAETLRLCDEHYFALARDESVRDPSVRSHERTR